MTRVEDRHGKIRWRFRMVGKASAYLPGVYASAEFRAAYEAAVAGDLVVRSPTALARGSFDWLIEEYVRTPKFGQAAPITRRNLMNDLTRFRRAHGARMVADLRPQHVEVLMAKLADKPAAANALRKLLRRLCRHAIKIKLIQVDPTIGVDRLATSQDGFHSWTDEEVAQFEAHHGAGSTARLALRLMLWTGAARQDVIALGRQNVRGGRIAYRRQKTGGDVDLPIAPALAEVIADLPAGHLLFLTWGDGQAYKAASFGNWFRDRCNEAGLPHCAAHGLRKAGATRLGEAGATELEIQAFLGHKTPDEARTYTRKANRAKLGDSGMSKLLATSNRIERLDNHRSKSLQTKEK